MGYATKDDLVELFGEAKSKYSNPTYGSGLSLSDGTLSTTDDLGITGAVVGQVASVKAVDANGVPTEWEAVPAAWRTLTVTLATTDGTTVTGQTVSLREGSSEGALIGSAPYEGTPVTFNVPVGLHYHVSATDSLRMQGPPSDASGTVGATAVSVTLTYASLESVLEFDDVSGRYANASLAEWWRRQRDGIEYGVSIPKGSATACTKTLGNAEIANPVPGYVGTPAIDPYATLGPFLHYDVNGGCDEDGSPFVTAIRGIDDSFALDGTNGDVWVMAPTLWWSEDASGDAVAKVVSDTQHEGLSRQPHACLPDGTPRPYMLYAKYAGCKGADGYMHSYSGYEMRVRDVSHNSCITQCRTETTGYSGKTSADQWYVQEMFNLKYGSKGSQSVFAGCSSYYLDYQPTVAETGVRRVIIAKTSAANLVVGSSVSIGSSRASNSVLGNTRILSIEDYDASNSAVYLDVSATFDTTTDLHLSTMPWGSGALDEVDGDGAITRAGLTNGKEPFVIQGIECMLGATEVLGNVIISNDGESGWVPYVNHDSRDEATSLTADYVSCGRALPTDGSDGWKYPLYAECSEGLGYGSTTGGSTSAGLCDGHYTNKLSSTGLREWLSFGLLYNGGSAGLWCVGASNGLGGVDWGIGGRLSANGRSRG